MTGGGACFSSSSTFLFNGVNPVRRCLFHLSRVSVPGRRGKTVYDERSIRVGTAPRGCPQQTFPIRPWATKHRPSPRTRKSHAPSVRLPPSVIPATLFCHSRHPFLSFPQVLSGNPSSPEKRKNPGCPITTVGHDRRGGLLFLVIYFLIQRGQSCQALHGSSLRAVRRPSPSGLGQPTRGLEFHFRRCSGLFRNLEVFGLLDSRQSGVESP